MIFVAKSEGGRSRTPLYPGPGTTGPVVPPVGERDTVFVSKVKIILLFLKLIIKKNADSSKPEL